MSPRTVPFVIAAVVALLSLGACSDEEADSTDTLRDAKVGVCLTAPLFTDGEYEARACSDAEARYRVLEVLDERLPEDQNAASPCDENPNSDYGVSLVEGDPRALCLQQTPEAGDCVYLGGYIPCEDGGGEKVDAVVEGTSDTAECPKPGQRHRAYEGEDPRVVCLSVNPVA